MSTGTVYRRESDGKWCASLTAYGKRLVRYGRTEREARQKLAQMQRELAVNGHLPNPGKRTVGDLLDTWLETAKPALKPKTWADYEAVCHRYIQPQIGAVKLVRLAPEHVQRLYNGLQARGLDRVPAQVHRVLHRACKFGLLWGWLAMNPCDRVIPPRYQPDRKEMWTPEQLKMFLDGTKEHWLGPLWTLAVASGARLGELLGLRWADVDLGDGTISIRRTGQHIRGEWTETGPKTRAGERVIALPSEGVAAAHKQRVQQLEWRLRAGPEWEDGDRVFINRRGGPLQQSTAEHAMRQEVERLNLPPMTPHGLRHWHASALLAGGLPLPDVSRQLGHANTHITASTYAHTLNGRDGAAARVLEAALAGR